MTYLVLNKLGQPMQIGHYNDTPKAGVLLNGDTATLFSTRTRARGAIKRSSAYAKRNGFDWRCSEYRIAKGIEQ